MAEETLVTFLFDCPTALRTVELLGSWDNFTKPYQLKRDRRRGYSIWSGCFTFDNIICDGDFDNTGDKRSGTLMMGGVYWYYYKVDDEDQHNPSEPSTTMCPLLPSQRMNVLEVPMENGNCKSERLDTFTRNPQDKFLTPVPPKPLPSPRLGDICHETYSVPMHHYGTPKSATYPSMSQSLSSGPPRHARSASTSPQSSSTALFSDFKSLKEKFAQKRSARTVHARSRSARELEIGAPTLISTTAEDVNLISLQAQQHSLTSSRVYNSSTLQSLPPPVTAKLRDFSPLRSNPVDTINDLSSALTLSVPMDVSQNRRRRSRSNPTNIPLPKSPVPTIIRANSSEIQRTKILSGQIKGSSPMFPQSADEVLLSKAIPAPVLKRLSSNIESPATDARPTSSHGDDRNSSLRKSPVDTDKSLPALPRFLVPAPLFACHSPTGPTAPEEQAEKQPPPVREKDSEKQLPVPEKGSEGEHAEAKESKIHLLTGKTSHFSLWSAESFHSSSPTFDDENEATYSPALSSLTSNCSDYDLGSPSHLSSHFLSLVSINDSPNRSSGPTIVDVTHHEVDATPSDSSLSSPLRLSSFGPSLFLDIQQRGESRRQAACFGFPGGGFQGYQLPEDETTSKVTFTEESISSTRAKDRASLGVQGHERGSSVSQLERLVDEFGFLGESVL